MHWYLQAFKKYAVFSGRATRKEFWIFTLIFGIVTAVLYGVGEATKPVSGEPSHIVNILVAILFLLWVFAHLVPAIAVTVRRLHDIGRSGWWYFIQYVPLIGPIVIIVFLVQDSQPHDNQYGPNPKMIADITLDT